MHEDPIDATKSIAESQLLANIGTGNDARLTGQNLGTIIRNKCYNLNLDLSKCVGQEIDGASNMNSEKRSNKWQNISYAKTRLRPSTLTVPRTCFNLCASQSVNVACIRNCIAGVRENRILQRSNTSRDDGRRRGTDGLYCTSRRIIDRVDGIIFPFRRTTHLLNGCHNNQMSAGIHLVLTSH